MAEPAGQKLHIGTIKSWSPPLPPPQQAFEAQKPPTNADMSPTETISVSNDSSNAAAAPSRYMFVTYNSPDTAPTSSNGKKRRGGPSEVRAHITKEFHRRLRVKRLDSVHQPKGTGGLPERPKRRSSAKSVEDVEDVEEVKREELELGMHIRRKSSDASTTSLPSSTPISTQRSGFDTSTTSPLSCSPQTNYSGSSRYEADLSLESVTRNVASTLGAGRVDPFNALPKFAGEPPAFIHKVLDHALVHTWPNTVPVRESSPTALAKPNPVKAAWLHMSMSDPVAFHAFIYATTLHILHAYSGKELSPSVPLLRQSYKYETIRMVNKALANLTSSKQPVSEGLIMAVTILSVHGQLDERVHRSTHPLSPLATAQNLHVYGSMINDEAHVQGILLLIAQKGGLESLETYGMADTMALCDLYFASKYIYPPNFPLRRPYACPATTYVPDAQGRTLSKTLGSSFPSLDSSPQRHQLLKILDLFKTLTMMLDHYSRCTPGGPDLLDLIQVRTVAQHRLLSHLAPLDADSAGMHVDEWREDCTLWALKLATLVFSDMALFPLPPTQGIKPRLATMLRSTLEIGGILESAPADASAIVWILTLGGIAASLTEHRRWYVEKLSAHVRAVNVGDDGILEAICETFIWWRPVCSEPTRMLWADVVKYERESGVR